jgi:glycosyltransferase involved in cell wall biosynthesis
VQVTGTVADLRDYLRRATIAVAPVPYGAGIQNKVLEAMACGAPVIASEQAASALHARDQHDLLVAGSSEEFAHAILALLNSPARRADIGVAGRRYVERYHSWSASAAHLEQIYGSVLHTVADADSVTRYAVAH